MPSLGVFHELQNVSDYLWNQCDGPMGGMNGFDVRPMDRTADVGLVVNWPVPPGGSRRAGGLRRQFYKLLKMSTTPLRVAAGYEWLDRPRETTFALFYEPPPLVPDWLFEVTARHCARIYAPDPRATHRLVLPSWWTFEDDLAALRAMPPPAKPVALAAINAGKPPGKALIKGHLQRLDFFRSIKRAGLPLELFGRGLPGDLAPRGALTSKAHVLRPARFCLSIENYDEGDEYVSEKLWDALLCWCLPVYHGPRAAEKLIPPEAFIRLPDLGERGVECVRAALADPSLWDRRLDAIAEARRLAMGKLRMVEWAGRELVGRR